MSRRYVSPSWGTVILAVLLTAALGCAAWGVTAWRSTPRVLRAVVTATGTLPVSAATFADPQEVTFTPTLRAGAVLRSPVAGVLTEFTCAPGQEVASGGRIGRVDNRPIVAVHTATPFWRALTVGSRGDDVEGLTKELARLGKLPPSGVSAHLSRDGFRAAMALAERNGNVLELGDLLWVPAKTVPVGTCDVQVGQTVESGTALLTQAPTLVNLHTSADLSGIVPGPRLVTLLGRSAPVVDGRVEDPGLLAAVSSANLLSGGPNRDGEPVTLPATMELAQPLTVVSVPAGSVKADGDRACVSVDGAAQPVTVVSSTLGRTLVSFSVTPTTVDLTPPPRCTS